MRNTFVLMIILAFIAGFGFGLVRDLVGHSSTAVTRIYTHGDAAAAAAAVASLVRLA